MGQHKPNGGIYFERRVYLSDAYKALSKNARMVLLAMLDSRQTNPAFKPRVKKGHRAQRFIGLDNIKMPYVQLRDTYGVPTGSIPRAIDDLLAKGFVEVRHAGGAGEHDMTIYALVEDYLSWQAGTVLRRRRKDVRRGFQGRRLGATDPEKQSSHAKVITYTHAKVKPFVPQK